MTITDFLFIAEKKIVWNADKSEGLIFLAWESRQLGGPPYTNDDIEFEYKSKYREYEMLMLSTTYKDEEFQYVIFKIFRAYGKAASE